jgi:hypothetical protein
MNRSNERPPFAAMANRKDYPNKSYLSDLKQNYAKRKDNIEIIKSNNKLVSALRALTDQIAKSGGHI